MQEIINSSFIKLIFELIILYSFGLLFTIIARKTKQPAFIIYIIGGILLGFLLSPRTDFKFIIDLFGGITIDSRVGTLRNITQIGLVFLLFLTGLETHTDELKRYGRHSILTAFFGVVTPFSLVFTTVILLGYDYKFGIVIGAVVIASSIGITKNKFISVGQENSDMDCVVKGSTIVDDIIGVVVISLLIIIIPSNALTYHDWLIRLIMTLSSFFSIVAIGIVIVYIDAKLRTRDFKNARFNEIIMGSIIFIFILTFFVNILGVSAIIGSYFAGLILSLTRLKKTILKFLVPIEGILIAPIYFISKGLAIDVVDFKSIVVIGIIIAIMTIIGKVAGASFGAKLTGLDNESSLRVGYAMIPIGEVAYLLASIARDDGILGYSELGSIVIVILITSIVGPLLLNSTYRHKFK
ncbi:MAG: cation:proton antiporter [Firmicutes bacterium]|nr:cation:proton antiporter [Bacillota bacterium]